MCVHTCAHVCPFEGGWSNGTEGAARIWGALSGRLSKHCSFQTAHELEGEIRAAKLCVCMCVFTLIVDIHIHTYIGRYTPGNIPSHLSLSPLSVLALGQARQGGRRTHQHTWGLHQTQDTIPSSGTLSAQPALGCPDGEEGTGRKASSSEREIAGFNHMNGANRPETLPNSSAYPLANPAFVWSPAGAGVGLESPRPPLGHPVSLHIPGDGMPPAALRTPPGPAVICGRKLRQPQAWLCQEPCHGASSSQTEGAVPGKATPLGLPRHSRAGDVPASEEP